MPIQINCPSCGRALRLPDELMGKSVRCPGCSTTFLAGGDEPAPRPQPRVEDEREAPRRPFRRDEGYDEEPRPSRRSRRDREEDDYDDRPPRRERDRDFRSGGPPGTPPGKAQAVAILTLVGGIVAALGGLVYAVGSGLGSLGICCLWPGWIYALVVGILAIIKGSALLGRDAHLQAPPTGIGIMMIINIVNFDPITCVLGILVLVFLSDPEVKAYYRGR